MARALSADRDPRPPWLLALMGLPGAGKSTLARRLAGELGWPVVDRDAIRAAMFPQARCGETEKRAANQAVRAAVEAHLRQRRDCIVDGMSFAAAAGRAELQALAEDCGAQLQWLWLDCPLAQAQQRLAHDRGHPAADRTAQLAAQVAARFAVPPAEALRLDACLAPEPLALAALAALRHPQSPKPYEG